jgi:hypothetical protein
MSKKVIVSFLIIAPIFGQPLRGYGVTPFIIWLLKVGPTGAGRGESMKAMKFNFWGWLLNHS